MSEDFLWLKLDEPDGDLIDTRLQVHRAVQIIAAVGAAHVDAHPDDSHRNLEWFSDSKVLAGNLSNTTPGFRVALNISGLELRILDETGSVVAARDLNGSSLDDAMAWTAGQIATLTGASSVPLIHPEYDLPDHPVASGAPFSTGENELQVLENWYRNSDPTLRDLVASTTNASVVRCWPHHFDIGLLISPIGGGNDAESQKSIGVGMTPGDGSYSEPYWYVNPWPYPTSTTLPPLAQGHWHTKGWVGAVLTASEITRVETPEGQVSLVDSYLRSAVTVAGELLA